MSNTLANRQMDERLKDNHLNDEFTFTLDRDQAEALYTVLGILECESELDGLHAALSMFCNGESSYQINEPDDTLRLWK